MKRKRRMKKAGQGSGAPVCCHRSSSVRTRRTVKSSGPLVETATWTQMPNGGKNFCDIRYQ
uniref:Uncharacterized protein n=1 Tax=Anguilla anguilla TaxID=7936 RepID=A0A0E9WUC5_ANGAN